MALDCLIRAYARGDQPSAVFLVEDRKANARFATKEVVHCAVGGKTGRMVTAPTPSMLSGTILHVRGGAP